MVTHTQCNEWTERRESQYVMWSHFGLLYLSFCFCQSISIEFLEVTCHSAPFPLLDLTPVGHMVAFTKGVLIKAELSKTKLLIVGF